MRENEYIYISVGLLMGVNQPKYELMVNEGIIPLKSLDDFFDGVQDSFERWYSIAGTMAPGIYSKYHTHSGMIEDIRNQFHKVLDIDDGTAFTERFVLLSMLDAFDAVMDLLAGVFTGPPELIEYYFNISSRLRLTFDNIINGGYN